MPRTHSVSDMVMHHRSLCYVFGKHSGMPGSVLSDESLPAHEHLMAEDATISSQEFRQLLNIREAARCAYHMADNSDVLGRAALYAKLVQAGDNLVKGNG